jgi:hypothetical protein
MIKEILPGLTHWTAFHEGLGHTVHSSLVLGSGTLIDPMEPEEGVEAIGALATPHRIVLSNRHHFRHSAPFLERFDCPVLCHSSALHDLPVEKPVQGFRFDEQIAEDVRGLELGAICPEETALLLNLTPCALSFGDGLTRGRDGSLAFMPDKLLGEDPEHVRAGLFKALRRLLEEDFDALLFAHGDPVLSGGHALLSEFVSSAESKDQIHDAISSGQVSAIGSR